LLFAFDCAGIFTEVFGDFHLKYVRFFGNFFGGVLHRLLHRRRCSCF
jgi:hypothetical protein